MELGSRSDQAQVKTNLHTIAFTRHERRRVLRHASMEEQMGLGTNSVPSPISHHNKPRSRTSRNEQDDRQRAAPVGYLR
eukprot:scaffold10571_cov154-Cylindrotheca_fusiformis.AAC.1